MVPSVEVENEHEHDHEHDHEHEHEHPSYMPPKPKVGRNEKKARKLLITPDMEEIPNIMRATFKKDEKTYFFVDQPTIYKAKNSDCYIVFGVVKVDNGETNAFLNNAVDKFKAPAEPAEEPAEEKKKEEEEEKKAEEPAEEVDETGVNPDDITFVMDQTGCTRAEAVKALRDNGNDMINAVMALGK